jgi:HK97 family phage major capsid protein
VTALPNAFVDDATFDVWGNVRDRLTTALAHCFDLAAINGTLAPANYPAGGIAAVMAPTSGGGGVNSITAAWAAVASRGGVVTSGIGGPMGIAALYGMTDGGGRPLYLTSLSDGAPSGLLGVPLYSTSVWPLGPATEFIVGDWNYAVVGVRQDITWDMSREGVITDAAGAVVLNAFQDDATIIRMYARIAFALPMGAGAAPFAGVKATQPVVP